MGREGRGDARSAGGDKKKQKKKAGVWRLTRATQFVITSYLSAFPIFSSDFMLRPSAHVACNFRSARR